MRSMLYLIPSLFFLLSCAAMGGLRDLPLARMQAEANSVTSEMNQLSSNISQMIQGITLGQLEQDKAQKDIDEANKLMAQMRENLESVWSKMDVMKVKAAEDDALRKVLKGVGLVSAFAGLVVMAGRNQVLAPYCLVSIAILMGLAMVW